MKRTWIPIGVLVALLGGACVLLGCGRVPLSTPTHFETEGAPPAATQEAPPSATPQTATPVQSAPTDPPLSTATTTSGATRGKEGSPGNFTIVFYTSIIYGDFRVLRVSSSGRAEFTKYDRVNQIWMYRQGDVGADRAGELFRLLEQKGFYQLEDEYDIYPLPTEDTRAYEDWYYAVKVSAAGRPEATVFSHTEALPSELRAIVNSLRETASALPERPAKGSFLLAGDYEILRYKRPIENEPSLQLDEDGLEEYPVLEKALRNPYSLVHIQSPEGTNLGEVLTPWVESVEVLLDGERFVVFLLNGRG